MSKFIDITGLTFGQLLVLKRVDNKDGVPFYLCRCNCGVEKIISSKSLKSGLTKTCGHTQLRENINGIRFGRLTVIKNGDDLYDKQRTVVCKCDCGNTVTVRYKSLKQGCSKSCGCLIKDVLKGRRFQNRIYADNVCCV